MWWRNTSPLTALDALFNLVPFHLRKSLTHPKYQLCPLNAKNLSPLLLLAQHPKSCFRKTLLTSHLLLVLLHGPAQVLTPLKTFTTAPVQVVSFSLPCLNSWTISYSIGLAQNRTPLENGLTAQPFSQHSARPVGPDVTPVLRKDGCIQATLPKQPNTLTFLSFK